MLHEYREEIAKLKQENAHFAKIFDEHNTLDQKISNMEQGIELGRKEVIDKMKKEKLKLKDEIHQMLKTLITK